MPIRYNKRIVFDANRDTRVLIVERDADTCQALARRLRLDGFKVEVAVVACGRGALEGANVRPPDVILLDLVSDADGRAFCREQRRYPALADTPVIVMTGLPPTEAAGKIDAAAFVSTACPMESLTATLLALLRSRRSRLRGKRRVSDSLRKAYDANDMSAVLGHLDPRPVPQIANE